MSETVIIAVEGIHSAPVKRFVRNKDVPLQKEVMRERLISARIMNGLSAVEAASRLGYANSTQLSLIESGERKMPNDWQFVLKVSEVYSVSMDYLIGISPNPERDAIASEHFAIMRSFEELQRKQAATMTTAFVRHAMVGGTATRDLIDLCTNIETVERSLSRMRELNPEYDEGMRGGATLLAAVTALTGSSAAIRATLGRRKENEQHFIDLASGKEGPLSYLTDDSNDTFMYQGA